MNTVFYNSIAEKKELKKQATARNERVLHDDFVDINEATTDGKSGRLTFDTSPEVIPPVVNIREEELKAKINTGVDLDLKEINELLRSLSL